MTNYNKTIVVSSNCQTGGLALTVRTVFPDHIVKPIPAPEIDNEVASTSLKEDLKDASFWVTSARFGLADGLPLRVVRAPAIGFPAFHPDLCYALNSATNQLTRYHYNSRIAVWAFNNRIEPADAARLFRHSTYRALGYFDFWAPSTAALRNLFLAHDFSAAEFDRFFLAVKRRGAFMYSVNHPRAETLVELGKLVAARLGADPSRLEREIVIPDALTDHIWPIYPEVGQELGLAGNHCWRIDGREIYGLRDYLDFAYRDYLDQGITPSQLVEYQPIPELDAILRAEMNNR